MYISENPHAEIRIESQVTIGKNLIFGSNCRGVEIGYGSFIGDNVYIDVPYLSIGEYTTVHRGVTIHGYQNCQIGHNCWIGQYAIIDSIGGTTVGNNVGIGAHSQLWSHIKFGDKLEGCLWNSDKKLIVENDVWFVGHCIVSPIHAREKSMLMVGGVITKDMEANHVYAGVPAKDVTLTLGKQFKTIEIDEKKKIFEQVYLTFLREQNILESDFSIKVVDNNDDLRIPLETNTDSVN